MPRGAIGGDQFSFWSDGECVNGAKWLSSRLLPTLAVIFAAANTNFLAFQRDRKSTVRQTSKCSYGAIETLCFMQLRSVQPQQPRTIGNKQRAAVGCESLGRVQLGHDDRFFEELVRLQRTVERWDRNRRFTAPEDTVGKLSQGRNHRCRPQRTSYWTKFGSALGSL